MRRTTGPAHAAPFPSRSAIDGRSNPWRCSSCCWRCCVATAGVTAIVISPPFLAAGLRGPRRCSRRLDAAGATSRGSRACRSVPRSTRPTARPSWHTSIWTTARSCRCDGSARTSIKAVLAIEDDSFYEHGALNLTSTFRALIAEHPGRQGHPGRLDDHAAAREEHARAPNDVSLARKFQELALAQRVEQHYSKDKILELYLNQVFLGNNVYGVGTAARFYFHKPASNSRCAEAAHARRPEQGARASTTRSRTRTRRGFAATTC